LSKSTKKLAQATRKFRKFHKYLGLSLCVFMFVIAASGLLLAWKKDFDFIPPTQTDVSTASTLPIEQIAEIAQTYILENTDLDPEINRIDIRFNKGAAKVRFENHYSEVQVGIYSGKILSVKTRTSDIIEQIHDGSIIDFFFKTSSDQVKKTYVTITCLGLMILSVTGFYLWLNPKRIKRKKRQSTH